MFKSCGQCAQQFEITDEDLEFYDKVSPVFDGKKYQVPPPALCRDCRLQRRMAWRNERSFYARKCGFCKKDIISVFVPSCPTPVYCNECWWSDRWDASKYGQELDFSRPFFDQLKELLDKVPQLTMQNDNGIGSVNSQYCQDIAYCKNCYFVIGTWYTEDSFYSSINASYNKWICDCTNVQKSELAYECINSQGLYNCAFVQNSENSNDCFLGFDLKGCRNCFGCVNLRQKEFYIFNKPYDKEEYRRKITSFKTDSFSELEKLKQLFREFSLQFPRKNMNLRNCENSLGDNLFNCKNTFGFALSDSEGCKYCDNGDINTFSYDIISSGRPNWCYEGVTPDDSYMSLFSWFSWKNKNLMYAFNCHSSASLFGCAAMHRAKNCILNRQYSKEEYEKVASKLVKHMKNTGEWGEFMPIKYSFFTYNDTIADEYFPLSMEKILANGWQWKESNKRDYQKQTYQIPDSIIHVPDSIIKEIIACAECGKNFKIVSQELVFYRKMNLPVPRSCSDCRHKARLAMRTRNRLWDRTCAKCLASIQTAYSPDRPEIIYCEQCYLKEVY